MSYKDDEAKHKAECAAARKLYEVWQESKKEEDKAIWWKALSSISSKDYLTIQLKIWPADGQDAAKIKELLENNGTNLPWMGENLYHGDQVLGEVLEARASKWPKPAM